MPPDQNDGLTPEEQQFFQTGDASVLGLSNNDPPDDPAPAPAPVVEAAPAPAPAPAPALDPAQYALDMERQRRMDAERRLSEATPTAKPAAEELPDPVSDPLGNIIAQLEASNRKLAALEAKQAEQQTQAELHNQLTQFTNNVRAMKDDFAKGTPDFDAAYQHLRDIRVGDLVDMGHSRADAEMQVNKAELQLAASALERGKNPAEMIYGMAKRYGYTAKAAAADPAPAPAAKPAAAAQKQAEDTVTRLSNGQFASRAPNRAAAPSSQDLTLEGLKDAGDSDLNKIASDDSLWKQVVGGKAGSDIFHR